MCTEWEYLFPGQIITGQETFYRRRQKTTPNRTTDNQCIIIIHILYFCTQSWKNMIVSFIFETVNHFIIFILISATLLSSHDTTVFCDFHEKSEDFCVS